MHLRRQHGLLRERIARLQEIVVTAVEYLMEAQESGHHGLFWKRSSSCSATSTRMTTRRRWSSGGAERTCMPRVGPKKLALHQGRLAADQGRGRARSTRRSPRRCDAGLPADVAAGGGRGGRPPRAHQPVVLRGHAGDAPGSGRRCTSQTRRFTATYDDIEPGLAAYVSDAIQALYR